MNLSIKKRIEKLEKIINGIKNKYELFFVNSKDEEKEIIESSKNDNLVLVRLYEFDE